MRQVLAKKQSNREWQGKTARACLGSHTFLIDGSWLLPTKRLFRSAANFDFHDNRPKMADLKSVYRPGNLRMTRWISPGFQRIVRTTKMASEAFVDHHCCDCTKFSLEPIHERSWSSRCELYRSVRSHSWWPLLTLASLNAFLRTTFNGFLRLWKALFGRHFLSCVTMEILPMRCTCQIWLLLFLTCTNSGSKCNTVCEPKLQLKSRPAVCTQGLKIRSQSWHLGADGRGAGPGFTARRRIWRFFHETCRQLHHISWSHFWTCRPLTS